MPLAPDAADPSVPDSGAISDLVEIRLKFHHEECHGVDWPPQEADQLVRTEAQEAGEIPDELCDDGDETVVIDLVNVTKERLEKEVCGAIGDVSQHREDYDPMAEIAFNIMSIVVVWEEEGKADWEVYGHADEELKHVLTELKAGGFMGYLYAEYGF